MTERRRRQAVKRLVDIVGALGGLALFAVPMAVIAQAILLCDGRPIWFQQERLGRFRQPFVIHKFHSMRVGEVTPIGRVLRLTDLDELSQFLNILCGELSAIGPRPLTHADVVRLGWTRPDCDFRWQVLPGLTGLAQVMGFRSARQSLSRDRYHVACRTLMRDLRLVALSFAINALGKRRVRRLIRPEPCGDGAVARIVGTTYDGGP
jgi:lipopolysaccharide/colanic/teichoic acid biosynthesis glycosyltransferase